MSAQNIKDMTVKDLLMVIAVVAVAAWVLWALGEWARDGLSGFEEYVGEAERIRDRVRRRRQTGQSRIFLLALGYGGPLVSVVLSGFGLYCGFYAIRGLIRRD